MKVCASAIILVASTVLNLSFAALEVELDYGTIRGREALTSKKVKYYAFQEIPYATPPVGELRFQAPLPPKKFSGVLNTTENTKKCYGVNTEDPLESEDCLYLNVYTPVEPGTNAKLPVLFYIHGGGFVDGSGIFKENGPHYFLDENIVTVVINYRLGPFGFLTTGTDTIKANNGLKDQTMALQWVQNYIEKFGGDKTKVTIMGQSAGGSSVTFHLLSNKSKGLFRGAVARSGVAIVPWSYQQDYRYFAYKTAKLIDKNFNSSDDKELLAFLMKADAEAIDTASHAISDDISNWQIAQGFYFAPIVEPKYEDAFVSENFYDIAANGNFNRIPLLIGINSEEMIDGNKQELTSRVQQYEAHPEYFVPHDMNIKNKTDLLLCAKAIKAIYIPEKEKFENHLGPAVKYFSDTCFNRGVTKFADLVSKYSDVYFYQFSYDGPMGFNNAVIDGADRVGHSEENPYIWVYDNNDNLEKVTKDDLLAHNRWIKILTNFIKYLNPTPEPIDLLEKVQFQKVKPGNFSYVNFNNSMSLHVNEFPKEYYYKKWLEVYDKFGKPPFVAF